MTQTKTAKRMKEDQYILISKEAFTALNERFEIYRDVFDDPAKDPVTVFSPLNARQHEELELIREVSRTLQEKKDEDMRKAKQAAEQAEEERKAEAQKAKEGTKEETEEKAEEPKEDVEEKKE